MKLIIGLGNPGVEYEGTRHNVGFEVVKALALASDIVLRKDKFARSLVGSGTVAGRAALLVLPQTYMNLSGLAAAAMRAKHKLALEDVLVVCDDLDLAFGRLKLKAGGSSAGHRGLQSIMDALHGAGFCRLRIGIGRPQGEADPADYVLSPFNARERSALPELIARARDCSVFWAHHGAAKAMNTFNKSTTEESKVNSPR